MRVSTELRTADDLRDGNGTTVKIRQDKSPEIASEMLYSEAIPRYASSRKRRCRDRSLKVYEEGRCDRNKGGPAAKRQGAREHAARRVSRKTGRWEGGSQGVQGNEGLCLYFRCKTSTC